MANPRRFAARVFDLLPQRNRLLYRACEKYIDRYNADNNCDIATNGEALLLGEELRKLRGEVVFDVGANVGNWAARALRVEPTIQLHCFEPCRDTFDRLSARPWPEHVYLNNFGLGDAEEQRELHVVEPGSGMNSLYVRHGVAAAQVASTETVSITTGDAYCRQKGIQGIGFLKIDVEGHDLAVFRGMERMLSEGRVCLIQFEYGGCNLDARVFLADIWEYLEPFGFRFYKLYPDGLRAVPEYSQSLETFRYANYVAKLA
jgi:FkbM family methyltransferase